MAIKDPILGCRDPSEIANYLRDIGDAEGAVRFEAAAAARGQGARLDAYLGRDQWAYSGVVIGHVSPDGDARAAIADAGAIEADAGLRGRRVKVTLDGFYVQSYPGSGRHRILCEFEGRNQVAGEAEELRFALTLEAMDGQAAAVRGKSIFMGVTVGDDGLDFRGRTVNVRSADDDLVLDALNGDAFKNGLALLSTAQPALRPFVGLAASVVRASLGRNKNRKVFEFNLGLDFNRDNASARLRRGTYVIVQKGGGAWDWRSFEFDRATRQLYRRSDGGPLELNHMVVGIDDHHGETVLSKPARATPARPTGR